MRGWSPKGFVNPTTSIAYHPAAVQFFKEKGVWTPEMVKAQARLNR